MAKQDHIEQVSAEQVAAMNAAVTPPTPLPSGFGAPSFSYPEKVYSTKDGKTTTHARYAVNILGTPFVLEGVIWRTVDEKASEVEFSVGLPRGIVLNNTKDADAGDTWRIDVLSQFDKWTEQVIDTKQGQAARREPPRLRKKLVQTNTTK